MRNPILLILISFSTSLNASGCFGYISYTSVECKNETPAIAARLPAASQKKPPTDQLAKRDILLGWGEPTDIDSYGGREIWLYKRKAWCGVIPAFVVAIPLMSPDCEVFEIIEFEGTIAKNLHIRRIVETSFWFALTWVQIRNEPACRYPLFVKDGKNSDVVKPDVQAPP